MDEREKPAAEAADTEPPKDVLTTRQTYNIVSDIVTGPNIRFRDNLFQGCVVLVFFVGGAVAGAHLTEDKLSGALTGGLLGLIAGALVGGFLLMLYRTVMHICGRHD